jgi:hypothetical protein
MNIYRELLAVDETALLRMRSLILEDAALERAAAYDEDIDLVIGEINRVRRRHDHWLALVDRMRSQE